jgi:hypothetical protein
MTASLVVVVGVTGAVVLGRARRAFAPHASQADCAALVDRYLEHLARQYRPDDPATAAIEARCAAHARPAWADDVRACQRDLTAAEVACGLAAPDLDALEQCLQ